MTSEIPSSLFVCKNNAGRSQIALAYYKELLPSSPAASAGTHVGESGGKVKDWRSERDSNSTKNIIDIALEDGLDIADSPRAQLTETDYMKYGRVVMMVSRSLHPSYVFVGDHTEFWDVADPDGLTSKEIRTIRDEIKSRIIDFAAIIIGPQ